MRIDSVPRGTRDVDQAQAGRPFEVHLTRWISETWIVIANDEQEAERLFDEGEMTGPVAVQEQGSYIQEIRRAN